MKAVFVELPAFERYRADYLDDASLRALQNALMKDLTPEQRKSLKALLKAELQARRAQ